MEFERYQPVYQSDEAIVLRKGQIREFPFDGGIVRKDERLYLFVTGETALHYLWKDEPDYPAHYQTIDDALDVEHAAEARYCLSFSNAPGVDYEKRVYKKIPWPPILSYLPMLPLVDDFTFGVHARAAGLKLSREGYLRMRLELHYRKDGVHPLDVSREPDETYTIDIPPGGYDWRELSLPVVIPAGKTACAGVWVEGEGYEGDIWFERPFLTSSTGWNLLPDFIPPVSGKQKFDWTAQNLSRKEWPEFRVTLNGNVVFEGERFERCHRRSEWSVPIPHNAIKPQNNVLSIELVSSYRDPLPYAIHEVSLIARPGAALTLVAVPDAAPAHGIAQLLIKTGKPNARVEFEGQGLSPCSPLEFEKAGLNTLALRCGEPALNATFTLRMDDCAVSGAIARVVEKSDDGVVTGTGDLIYVKQEEETFEEFLGWYMANHVGNLLTIRPTYRWCGSRTLKEAVWAYAVRILNGMGMKYAHMVDGRELPGRAGNPTARMLSGDGFLGRQDHERDGAQFYWGPRASNGSHTVVQYYAMEQRIFREAPEQTYASCASENYFYDTNQIQQFRPVKMPDDVKEAADFALKMLSVTRFGNQRHTGPSMMFKYFYEAGYEWSGAETMYGSLEPIMSFLRGAALCYGKKALGVHHAVQWSSSPHDTPDRFRRYRLALYVSYMQGATEINTEEGLWHIEEYYAHFNRFSGACLGHLRQQQDFYRFVSTHTRKGEFYAPMALLHGRLDGWHAFGRDRPWGIWHAKDSDAEKSWDLLKVFYPLSKPGRALYIHDCPSEPAGYYTGTPHGNFDALPVESGASVLSRYKALAFMGYNRAQEDDLDRLLDYVRTGGRLLLGWAHLNQSTALADIAEYRHVYIDHPLVRILGEGLRFETKAYKGRAIELNVGRLGSGSARVKADDGTPIVVDFAVGDGVITLVNVKKYPAAEEVRLLYEEELRRMSDALLEKEPAYIECSDDVAFTVYDLPDERHFYLLAVDWYRDPAPSRHAALRLGAAKVPIDIPFGVMYKIVVAGTCAAWAASEDGEVLGLGEDGVTVQGVGTVEFVVVQNGKARRVSVDFAGAPVETIRN